MTQDETGSLSGQSDPDVRSVLLLAEPTFGPDGVSWRGMAFAGGELVNHIIGSDRTVVLDDCVAALASADVDLEVEALDG